MGLQLGVVSWVPCQRLHALRAAAVAAQAAAPYMQALRLKRRGGLLRVAVVGTGYIGTELSANLASWLGPNQLALTLVRRRVDT